MFVLKIAGGLAFLNASYFLVIRALMDSTSIVCLKKYKCLKAASPYMLISNPLFLFLLHFRCVCVSSVSLIDYCRACFPTTYSIIANGSKFAYNK